jgi:heme-degrading monooxygenase HmoA
MQARQDRGEDRHAIHTPSFAADCVGRRRPWVVAGHWPAVAAGESTGSEKVKIVNLADRVTFRQQFEHNTGPVVLMSTFLVAPDEIDNVLDGFRKQFAIMRKQPGLISARLHRCVAGSSLFMNYIVWEWVDDFKRGYELPEVQSEMTCR